VGRRSGDSAPMAAKAECSVATTWAPSPPAAATRLIEPEFKPAHRFPGRSDGILFTPAASRRWGQRLEVDRTQSGPLTTSSFLPPPGRRRRDNGAASSRMAIPGTTPSKRTRSSRSTPACSPAPAASRSGLRPRARRSSSRCGEGYRARSAHRRGRWAMRFRHFGDHIAAQSSKSP
jgi:hypothetical protein